MEFKKSVSAYLCVQAHDEMRHFFTVNTGVQVGQMEVVPEHRAIPPVVQKSGSDVLSLLESQIQALALQTDGIYK